MPTLDKHIVRDMLDGDIMTVDLNEPKDGDQILQFHYVSPLGAIKRLLADPAYANKLYTQFEYEFSAEPPFKRTFRRVNSGMAFKFFSAAEPCSLSCCICAGQRRVILWTAQGTSSHLL